MEGKELLFKAFALEKTERTPWVPFVGCHGGYLIDKGATEYLQSVETIVAGVGKAIELYQPDGIPVIFDLQVEAEALGCELKWRDDNPPAVVTHPLQQGVSLDSMHVPGPDEARIPVAIEAAKRLKQAHPDIALYGLVTGPFTLALHLLGTDIFTKMMMEPEEIHTIMSFAEQVTARMSSYYIEAGCDVIAVVDPMTSQIDPASFEMFVSEPATRLFQGIRDQKAWGSFFVCGQAQQNIEVMCKCKPDNVSIDENIPLDYVKDTALKHDISFGGNLKLTVVLLMGTPEDCQTHAIECMDIAGDKGFILAPGCDLPLSTPPDNLKAITALVRDPYKQEVARTLEKKPDQAPLLDMKEYGQADTVIVDIITLDSESCAPCQYMVEAVKQVSPQFEGIVEWREHTIKDLEGVTFMSSLMVKNIPAICIDGKIAFVSQIPPRDKLIAAIQQRVNEKLRMKIQTKRSELLLLGRSREECDTIKERAEQAMTELGKYVDITTITDEEEIKKYGVVQTPAVITLQRTVKTQASYPSVEILKEWIKNL